MKSTYKIFCLLFISLTLSFCTNKKTETVSKEENSNTIKVKTTQNNATIEGIYETQPEPDNTDDCKISVEIKKETSGYTYFLKTKLRKLKGKVSVSTNESGEKFIVLEGIQWDDFEGDISNEEETDSITATKELEIPVGIDAGYIKDTLIIQNYGNSMNSYTKISECGRKYIQLIKK